MHITASVFINDDEPGLHHDFEVWLEKLAPEKPYSQYKHNGFEDNADAHIKRTIMGREVVVAVTNGKLDFGPWEQIFYGEFDGKRRKTGAREDNRRIMLCNCAIVQLCGLCGCAVVRLCGCASCASCTGRTCKTCITSKTCRTGLFEPLI